MGTLASADLHLYHVGYTNQSIGQSNTRYVILYTSCQLSQGWIRTLQRWIFAAAAGVGGFNATYEHCGLSSLGYWDLAGFQEKQEKQHCCLLVFEKCHSLDEQAATEAFWRWLSMMP
jgi:hypothetical protein